MYVGYIRLLWIFFLSVYLNISNRRNTHALMRKLVTTRHLRQYYYLLSFIIDNNLLSYGYIAGKHIVPDIMNSR